jgi:hypothetical protein
LRETKVTGAELDEVLFFFAVPVGILVGYWCKSLFYRGKLFGYRPEAYMKERGFRRATKDESFKAAKFFRE